jgi:hypothetical protein
MPPKAKSGRSLLKANQTTPFLSVSGSGSPPKGLALFSAHAVLDEFSHAARAGACATRVAALPGELFASLLFGLEHTGMLSSDAGPSLGANRDRPTIFCKCT